MTEGVDEKIKESFSDGSAILSEWGMGGVLKEYMWKVATEEVD